MSVLVGSARIDENGKISGGQAGDQTGNEVCTQEWYSKPWDFMAIHPDPNVREKHAQAVEQACANDNVGYDQGQRNTLNAKAAVVDYIIKNIASKCECDCSSLQNVAAISSGAEKAENYGSNGWTTSSMRGALIALGYIIITASEYLRSAAYCLRGAIYVSEGHHTVAGLSNGSDYKKTLEKAGLSASSSGTTSSTGSTSGSTTSSTSTNHPTYIVGETYILQCNLAVRKDPDGDADLVGYAGLTDDGKKHDTDKNGYLEAGTKVTCKEVVKKSDNEVWIRTPSGYMCGYDSKKVYISTASASTSSSSSGSYSTTKSSGSTSSSTSSSSSKPNYEVNKTYTLQCNLAVRKSPSGDAALVGYKFLTPDAQKHDTDKNGYLEAGTKVTCKGKVQKSANEVWIKTPSGYMCGYDSKQVYIK